MRGGLGLRAGLWVALMLGAGTVAWLVTNGRMSSDARALVAGVAAVLTAIVARALVLRPSTVARAVGDGLLAYTERDYSIRLTADVEDVCACGGEGCRLGHCLLRRSQPVAGERIWREVDDGDDVGAAAPLEAATSNGQR